MFATVICMSMQSHPSTSTTHPPKKRGQTWDYLILFIKSFCKIFHRITRVNRKRSIIVSPLELSSLVVNVGVWESQRWRSRSVYMRDIACHNFIAPSAKCLFSSSRKLQWGRMVWSTSDFVKLFNPLSAPGPSCDVLEVFPICQRGAMGCRAPIPTCQTPCSGEN